MRGMKTPRAHAAVVALVLLAFAGCGSSSKAPHTPIEAGTTTSTAATTTTVITKHKPTTTTVAPTTVPPVTVQPLHPTALCNDGTYSYAAAHQGACSGHGGVAVFFTPDPACSGAVSLGSGPCATGY
jgi:hypothetical protein